MKKGYERNSPIWRAYHIWCQIKYRCKSVKKYQGVTVCNRWINNFDDFLKDMGLPPDGYSIDRVDGTKGYEPNNCRWADVTTQNRNRRTVKLNQQSVDRIKQLAKEGILQRDIGQEFGVDPSTISLVVRGKIWRNDYVLG
jgi:hypothetical protein